MAKELFLLRGCPGSGKSTLAESIGGTHLEADMYFMKDGEYQFDATKLKNAHEWCRIECERAMAWELKVVVSNTFTQEWEMQAYYDLARKHDYRVFSLIVENRHGGVNLHNVPAETLEKMKQRFEVKL